MNKHLILIRGLPGSGKSTLAKLMIGTGYIHYLHFEADMWFEYCNKGIFEANLLPKAHSWCLEQTEKALESGISVIVSNTFTQEWELSSYVALAQIYNARLTSIVVENRHGNSSIHNVPETTVQKMRNRFEVKL